MVAHALVSRVTGVTIYRSGALVERTAELIVEEGEGLPESIRITGLPLSAEDRSVRVRMVGSADGETPPARATDLRVVLDVPERDPALRAPDPEALRQAELYLARCEAAERWWTQRLQRSPRSLATRPDGAEGEPPPRSPVQARLELVDWSAQRMERLHQGLADARDHLRKAREALAEQQEQERRRTQATQAREHELRKSVIVRLAGADADAGARGRLMVEYRVPGARWVPAYTVRIEEGEAELAMRAMVAQNTGEDWDGVDVKLSTADPLRWCERPELDSIRIGRRQPPKRSGWRPPPDDTDALFADYDRFKRHRPPRQPTGVSADQIATRPSAPPAPPPSSAPAAAAFDAPVGAAAPEPEMMMMASVMPMEAEAPVRRSRGAAKRKRVLQEREELAFDAPSDDGLSMTRAGSATMTLAQAMEAFGHGGGGPGAPPRDDGQVTAAESMLDYGALRLNGPDAAGERGRLAPAGRATLYMELLSVQQVSVAVDVGSLLAGVQATAQSVDHADLPSGCAVHYDDKYAYAYPCDVPATVPSDGEWHGIGVTSARAPVGFRHVVVPRESTDVFRVAEVSNPLQSPLLPGPADVYVGRDFLLSTAVAFTAPEATVSLGLGVEQAVKVVRNTAYREESAGLLGGSTVLAHTIKVEADNHTGRAVRLEIRERVPHVDTAAEDDISVEVTDAEPAWQPWPTEDAESEGHPSIHGAYRWFADLDAGARQVFEAKYAVRISAKQELVGGNRREG